MSYYQPAWFPQGRRCACHLEMGTAGWLTLPRQNYLGARSQTWPQILGTVIVVGRESTLWMLSNASEERVSLWKRIFNIIHKHLSHSLFPLVCADIRKVGIHYHSGNCFKWPHRRQKHQDVLQKDMLGRLLSPTKCFKTTLSAAAWTLIKHLHSLKVSCWKTRVICCVMKGDKALLPRK